MKTYKRTIKNYIDELVVSVYAWDTDNSDKLPKPQDKIIIQYTEEEEQEAADLDELAQNVLFDMFGCNTYDFIF